jgi:hypothetical protein
MRRLVIACETRHAGRIRQGIERLAHPRLAERWVEIYDVDLDGGIDKTRARLQFSTRLAAIFDDKAQTTSHPLLVATREVNSYLAVATIANTFGLDYDAASVEALMNWEQDRPVLQRTLNRCDLSLIGASSAMLSHWSHQAIGRHQL